MKNLQTKIAVGALFAVTACAGQELEADRFEACAEAALNATGAGIGNDAGSAFAVGSDPDFVMMNGTTLTRGHDGAVTATGPHARDALIEYAACKPRGM